MQDKYSFKNDDIYKTGSIVDTDRSATLLNSINEMRHNSNALAQGVLSPDMIKAMTAIIDTRLDLRVDSKIKDYYSQL